MKEIRKKIIALSLISTMITGVTACKKYELEVNTNPVTQEQELVGKLKKEDLKNCYIVEVQYINGFTNLLLYYDSIKDRNKVKENINNKCKEYGEVITIISLDELSNFIEDKNVYTSSDINNILINITKNYPEVKFNRDVKKLELK